MPGWGLAEIISSFFCYGSGHGLPLVSQRKTPFTISLVTAYLMLGIGIAWMPGAASPWLLAGWLAAGWLLPGWVQYLPYRGSGR